MSENEVSRGGMSKNTSQDNRLNDESLGLLFCYFFFLMIRRPPGFIFFPYRTLFRFFSFFCFFFFFLSFCFLFFVFLFCFFFFFFFFFRVFFRAPFLTPFSLPSLLPSSPLKKKYYISLSSFLPHFPLPYLLLSASFFPP